MNRSEENAPTGKHSFKSPAAHFFHKKTDQNMEQRHNQAAWVRRSNQHVLAVPDQHACVLYLSYPTPLQKHKQPSVFFAALMNRSTSSAKSKARGHGRHHCWFVKSPGVSGRRASGGMLSKQQGASRVAGADYWAQSASYTVSVNRKSCNSTSILHVH